MKSFEALLEEFFYRPDEDVSGLFDPGPLPEPAPPPAPEEPPREYVAFRLGAEVYAVPVEAVREIARVPPITHVPRAAPELLGISTRRGQVLPVFDLKPVLGLSDGPARIRGEADEDAEELPAKSRIVVLRDGAEGAAVLVDEVVEVVRLRASAIEAPGPGVGGAGRTSVSGIGRRGERLYILLDPAQVLP